MGITAAVRNENSSGGSSDFPRYTLDSGLKGSLEQAPLTASVNRCREGECDQSLFQSVGLVIFVNSGDPDWGSYEAGQCTGFLFGSKNIVALNSHCITDKVKENKERCSEFLGIQIPFRGERSEEVRMCKELLYVSPLQRNGIQVTMRSFGLIPSIATHCEGDKRNSQQRNHSTSQN